MVDAFRPYRVGLRGTIAAVALAWLSPAPAAAQSIWDDPAFSLYRQGVDALDALRVSDSARGRAARSRRYAASRRAVGASARSSSSFEP